MIHRPHVHKQSAAVVIEYTPQICNSHVVHNMSDGPLSFKQLTLGIWRAHCLLIIRHAYVYAYSSSVHAYALVEKTIAVLVITLAPLSWSLPRLLEGFATHRHHVPLVQVLFCETHWSLKSEDVISDLVGVVSCFNKVSDMHLPPKLA